MRQLQGGVRINRRFLLVRDEFVAADDTDLGGRVPDFSRLGSTWVETSGAWKVTSNRARHDGAADQRILTIDCGQANIYIETQIYNLTGTPDAGLVLRVNSDTQYILFTFDLSATNHMTVWRRDGGFTQLADATPTFVAGDIIRILARGPQYYAWINDRLIHSVQSTFQQTLTKFGLRDSDGGGENIQFEYFRAWAA